MKPKGFIKTIIALLALVVVTMTLGIAIKVGAEEPREQENVLAIKMEEYTTYEIYPDGYKARYYDKVEFSGTYILTGNPTEDIVFKSNGTPVTYNVIFHNLNAVSDLWYGMIGLDPYVTLNITVYGDNSVIAHNHPGFSINGSEDGERTVNITMTESSSLEVGCNYYDTQKIFADEIEVNLLGEAQSTVDMSTDGWRNNMRIVFTSGTALDHEMGYVYVDGDVCRYECKVCDLVSIESEHEIYGINYEEDHADYATKHSRKCILCQYEFDVEEHETWYVQEENYHIEVCRGCYYEGEMQDHVINGDGCEVCGFIYSYKHEADGEETYVFTTDKAIELLGQKGGKLTVLNDVEELFSKRINIYSKDATIDLAGNKLIGVSVSVGGDKALYVIDSSDSKSGVWEKGYDSNNISGTIYIDGVTVTRMYITANGGSTVTVKDTVCTESFGISAFNGSSIEITNVTFEERFEINFSAWSNEPNIEISECTFGEIKVSSSFGEDVYVNMLLEEGYAFAGEDGLIDGSGTSVNNVTAIVEHTEHNADKIQTSSAEHWNSCTCGNSDASVKEKHSLGDNGLCPICGALIVASLTVGEETKYYTSIVEALEVPGSGVDATVVLLADFEPADYKELKLYANITLDLNGYTYSANGRLTVLGKLTIDDSSEGKTGKLYESGDLSYIIEFHRDSSVVINSGEFYGLIYGAVYGTDTATITINGGRFLGSEKFRLSSGVHAIINGGVFECSNSVFSYTWSSGVTYEINGGVFVNSTVFRSTEEYRPESLEAVLGTGTECELAFVSANGEVLTLEDVCSYYEGEIYVFHKNSDTAYNDVVHKLYCYDCKEYSTEINHTKVYTLSTSDGGVHDVSCRVCDMSICSESHRGGAATCTAKAECERCLAPYGDEPQGHIYDNDCDTECNVCNEEREVPDHVYDNACDTECNVCKDVREVPDHVYDNACDSECNVCKDVREVPDHVYDNACDSECNVCKDVREVPDHVYENACDTECAECKYTREITHEYGADGICAVCKEKDPNAQGSQGTSTTESGTTDKSDSASTADTSTSSSVQSGSTPSSAPIPSATGDDDGLGAGAIVGIVLGSVVVVAAGITAVIIIRKKKFTNI